MSPQPTSIVLTGVGLDGGPDVIRALRADDGLRARVVGVDSNPRQAGAFLCDAFHTVPAREDPAYLDTVTEIARAESASVIYPLPTFDQEIFAAARDELAAAGLGVPVSPLDAVRTCNDKWDLYSDLRDWMPEVVPETVRVQSGEELSEAVGSLGYPERRVCIRRRVSRGAIGLRLLEAGPARLDALLRENPGSLLVSLDEVLATLQHAAEFPEYLVQEYLAPDEWDVDVLCRDGEALVVVTRRNLAMTGSGTAHAVLEQDEELTGICSRIVSRLKLNAVVNLAFRRDSEGGAKLLEINPRIPSSVLSALAGGVNLPALAVRQALGEWVEPAKPEWGGEFLRHFSSVVVDPAGAKATEVDGGP